jgi:hypothetical protein
MDLHLRDLRFFETVAELGHMGRAAAEVGRSQPRRWSAAPCSSGPAAASA